MNKPMPLLLIEDDVSECAKFKNYANGKADVCFIGITNSSEEGIRIVKNRLPEGVILDLELHKGKGSGLQFLVELKESSVRIRPIVIVTTNSPSNLIYNYVHGMGADLVFYKKQEDYSPEMVVNTMLVLRKSLHRTRIDSNTPDDLQTIESPEERRSRITARIDAELELVGINTKYKGYEHLRDAIFLLINKENECSEAAIVQVSKQKKLAYSSVSRAMQTAINKAWERTSIDDLQTYYTARVNYKTGVPTPTDFIHYYADKIRKSS